jgi:hypothetical protein
MTHAQLLPLDDHFPLALDAPFTRAGALRAGLTDKRLRTLVRRGHLRRPVPGVYVAAHLPDSLALRSEVLRLVVPPGCFVCDETAAWVHGADMALAPNSHLALPRVSFFRHADAGRLRNGLVASGERTVTSRDLVPVGGLLVTTPLRTALDLGRLRHRDQALSALDAFLHLGLVTHEELLASLDRFARQRGVVQLRWLVAIADGRAESAGESALRLRWYDAGLPRPQLQISVFRNGVEIFRLDLGLEELLFAAEYDGVGFHTSREQRGHDDGRRSELRERLHWVLEVFDHTNVYGQQQDAATRLRAAWLGARSTLGERTFII